MNRGAIFLKHLNKINLNEITGTLRSYLFRLVRPFRHALVVAFFRCASEETKFLALNCSVHMYIHKSIKLFRLIDTTHRCYFKWVNKVNKPKPGVSGY